MIMSNITKIATGGITNGFHLRGEWKTTEGKIVRCWDSDSYPDQQTFSGTVVGEYPLQVGGNPVLTTSDDKIEYLQKVLNLPSKTIFFADLVGDNPQLNNTQLNKISKVVEIPVEAKFTIELTFTKIKVVLHHSEDELKELEHQYKLRKLNKEYSV